MTDPRASSTSDLDAQWSNLSAAANKGAALEQFCSSFFGSLPGVEVHERNIVDEAKSQEIDLVLWNHQVPTGLNMLDQILFVEAKNWSDPVGSAEVAWFDWKIRLSGRKEGFLVAANGITGRRTDRSSAWQIVFEANLEGRRLIIVSPDELYECQQPAKFQELVRQKLVKLSTRCVQLP